jgi:PadR family transcriptional regulator AphA
MLYTKLIYSIMARESKSKFLILGLLAQEELSGYDIKRIIEERLCGCWDESFGQIYPTLQSLEEGGLARKSIYRQEGKPDRHVYKVTAKGEEALREWLTKPSAPHKERIEALVKVYLGSVVSPAETRKQLEAFRQEQAERLAQLREVESTLQQQHAGSPALPYWLLTLHCSLQVTRTYLNWCDDTIAILQRKSG